MKIESLSAGYRGKAVVQSVNLEIKKGEISNLSFFVTRKPRDSRVVEKRLTDEQKSKEKSEEK